MTNTKPIVCIRCLVYNHEKYLRQCLDGFVTQKTNFRFEAIVHDDVSTDKSAEIIREYAEKYPDMIKPIFENENQYSKHNGSLERIVNKACTGKYIALCEGDDYWIDPLKLQKQVDFLEANPDYGMCHTGFQRLYQASHKIEHNNKSLLKRNGEFKDLLNNGNYICTATTLFRKEAFQQYYKEIQPENRHWLMGDYPMWLWFAKNTKIHFIPDETSVYRILNNSASHSTDYRKRVSFFKSTYEIQNFFGKLYNEPVSNRTLYIANYIEHYYLAIQNPNKENLSTLRDSIKKIQYEDFRFSRVLLRFISFFPSLFKIVVH